MIAGPEGRAQDGRAGGPGGVPRPLDGRPLGGPDDPADGDDALLGELREVMSQVDPVPGHVLAAARAAFALRDLDRELAALVADSATSLGGPALVRAPLAVRLLSFEAAETGVELELVPLGQGFDLQGQVLGGVRGPVAVDHPGGVTHVAADEQGRFEVPGLRSGRLRLRWTDGAGRRTATVWFEL